MATNAAGQRRRRMYAKINQLHPLEPHKRRQFATKIAELGMTYLTEDDDTSPRTMNAIITALQYLDDSDPPERNDLGQVRKAFDAALAGYFADEDSSEDLDD